MNEGKIGGVYIKIAYYLAWKRDSIRRWRPIQRISQYGSPNLFLVLVHPMRSSASSYRLFSVGIERIAEISVVHSFINNTPIVRAKVTYIEYINAYV
jgi:hypothetical protein